MEQNRVGFIFDRNNRQHHKVQGKRTTFIAANQRQRRPSINQTNKF